MTGLKAIVEGVEVVFVFAVVSVVVPVRVAKLLVFQRRKFAVGGRSASL